MPRFGHSLPKEKLGGIGVPSWLPDWLTGKDVREIQGPVYIPPRGKAGGYRKELAADIARQAKDPFTQRDIYSTVQAGADFVPLMGEDVGVREAAEDWQKGNKISAIAGGLGTALGVVPIVGDVGGKLVKEGGKKLAKGLGASTLSAVKPTLEEFTTMAGRGQIRQARTPQQDLSAIIKGKVAATDFDINAGHPFGRKYEEGRLTKQLEDAGLVVDDDRMGRVVAGRTQTDVDALKNAKTAAEYGRIYGYSDDDIAAFYLKRRGGDPKLAYEEFVREHLPNVEKTASAVVDPLAPAGLGVTNLGAVRQERKVAKDVAQIKDVVANFEGDALKRGADYHKAGKLPVAVGTRMIPPRGSGDTAPWEVTGHYVDPNNPERYGYHLKDPVTGDTRIEIANDPRLGVNKLIGWKPMGIGGAVDPVVPKGLGIRAYHGSPHSFEEFDISKIGTGEGAQAYGHGLYFAENRSVAEAYNPSTEQLMAELASGATSPERVEEINRLLDLKADKGFSGPGHMYEVDIAADPEAFLDWDKPIAEQPRIAAAIDERVGDPDIVFERLGIDPKTAGGSELVRGLGGAGGGKDPAVTAKLQEWGFPGIRYLDQGSRMSDEAAAIVKNYGSREKAMEIAQTRLKNASLGDIGYWQKIVDDLKTPESRNYVVFDPKIISIVKKYGLAAAISSGLITEEMGRQMQEQGEL